VPVAIVSDSAASLTSDVADRHGVITVPMQLEIAGRPIAEDDVPLEELVAHLDEGVLTSGPAPGAFAEAIDAQSGENGVVVLTVADRLSSTYQSAVAAAKMSANPGMVRVVDTGTAAGAQGLVVLAAAEAARAGASLDEVAQRAEEVAGRVRLVAAVDQLTYLVRGGRLPARAAWAGSHLGMRVLFELRSASIRPLRPVFSRNAVSRQILRTWRRSRVPGGTLHVAALHALRSHEAEVLLAAVQREVEPAVSFIGTFGPVMVAHTGPGVIGLAWWWG
jgi:DegV family protein with EDD domain